MFSGLRLRLTALYLGAALLVLALVSGAAYGLLRAAFQSTTDLALRYELAQEFHRFAAPLPPDLAAAVATWSATHVPAVTAAQITPTAPEAESEGPDSEHSTGQPQTPGARVGSVTAASEAGAGSPSYGGQDGGEVPESYDAELAAIFVLPLDARGAVLARLSAAPPTLQPNRAAAQAALARGSDWRIVRVGNQSARLASYRIRGPAGLAVLQAGRTLGDQATVLQQLVVGLLVLGGAATLGLGAGSWWLAGRSLRPAQESWQRQQAFVANASHELRAPLTLLRASAEVTQRHLPASDTRGRALLADVLGECDHMARLVEDLLVLSKLDAGALVLERQAVAVPAFLLDLVRQVGPLAHERGVHLSIDAGAEGMAWADPTRLRQVLLILLDNALRYTPRGGSVRLAARPRGRHVAITVADTGAGIASEHLPHLFERFYRGDQARMSSPDTRGGSGLGLAIAQALVAAHNGHIHLGSRLGAGTTVEVTLPSVRP
jgi:signal transduction histidine kinase